MKRIYIAILTGGMFFMLTVLTAEVKEKKGDAFLRINDNIQNEELRAELAALREGFNIERTRIHEYYNEKMEALKEARRGEMKSLKTDFTGRRDLLMKQYVGKIRKRPQMRATKPVENAPEKMKAPKRNKIRKPQ